METSSFCSSYRLIHTPRLSPLPTAGNGLNFSASLSFNGVPLSRSKEYGSCKARSSPSSSSSLRIRCGKVPEINETEFSDVVLKSDRPVLVEFVATWCGPCRLIAPAIEALAQEYEDKLAVVKVDHDANPRLIDEYKVYGLPMLILFKDGKEVPESRREGAITKVKLKGYIDGLLESATVS